MAQNDSYLIEPKLLKSYLEMIVGIMSLRVPAVQSGLLAVLPPTDDGYAISSSYKGEDLIIPIRGMIEEIQTEGFTNLVSLRNNFEGINSIFLIAMWDVLNHHPRYQMICNEPEVQFFKHIRNGCGHGNRFNFGTISMPAKWRDKEISSSMNEAKVFPNLLKDGDAILLVLDINNKFFKPLFFAQKS